MTQIPRDGRKYERRNKRTNEHTNIRTDERKNENYIPLGINAGGINIVFKSATVKSYLPILQYDATLFGNHNTRKLKEEMITFNLRPHSAFPKMGVF